MQNDPENSRQQTNEYDYLQIEGVWKKGAELAWYIMGVI
jgi:hypothetical protein